MAVSYYLSTYFNCLFVTCCYEMRFSGSALDRNIDMMTMIVMKSGHVTVVWFNVSIYLFLLISLCQIDRMGQKDAVLEEEVRYRYNSVILNYKKSQDNAQR